MHMTATVVQTVSQFFFGLVFSFLWLVLLFLGFLFCMSDDLVVVMLSDLKYQ
jgi:hypothetical protein